MSADNLARLPVSQPAATDMTEDEARTRLAAMAALAGALAHDLSRPLSAAMSFLHGCTRELHRADDLTEVLTGLERAQAQTHRALSVIRRMRAFVVRGRVETSRESLRMMLARVRSRLMFDGGFDADLAFAIPDGANLVQADRMLVEHVLSSLILEAFDSMQGQDFKRVEIESRARGDEVEILVRDCGPGVSATAKSALLEPGRPAEAAEAGLALLVCKAVVEAHDGRIWADPDYASGGLIRFTLPAAN